MNRKIAFLMVLPTACAPVSCDSKLAFGGPVAEIAPRKLSGAFEIVEWSSQNGGIQSDNKGGACMVVAMRDVVGHEQMKCTTADRTCKPGPLQIADTWYTYCDLSANARPDEEGQCWGKPINRPAELQAQMNRQFCKLSIEYVPPKIWPDDTDIKANREPVDLTHAALRDIKRPSRWRINACLLDKAGKQHCTWGPISEIP